MLSGLERSLDGGRSGVWMSSKQCRCSGDLGDAVAEVSTLGHTVPPSLSERDIVMVVRTTMAGVCILDALKARCSSSDSCMMLRISSGSPPSTYPSSSGISISCHDSSSTSSVSDSGDAAFSSAGKGSLTLAPPAWTTKSATTMGL